MRTQYEIFMDNIKRVENFTGIYSRLTKGSGSGRRGMLDTDVLRAAVVFLHSSVENYIRNVIYDIRIKNLDNKGKCKEEICRLYDGKGTIKIAVDSYWDKKGKSIRKYIKEQLECEKETSTFNNYSQIHSSLKSVGIIIPDEFDKQDQINDYTKRRHKIVHEADINVKSGRGNHRTEPISPRVIKTWIEAAKELVDVIEESRKEIA